MAARLAKRHVVLVRTMLVAVAAAHVIPCAPTRMQTKASGDTDGGVGPQGCRAGAHAEGGGTSEYASAHRRRSACTSFAVFP